MSKAPAHLVKLEFHLEKETLATVLKDIHRELNEEEMLVGQQINPETILGRNAQLLNGSLPTQAKQSLERLSQIQHRWASQHPQDGTLREGVEEAKAVFQSVMDRAQALGQTLQNIPQQWNLYKNK